MSPKLKNYASLWHMNIAPISLVCAKPFFTSSVSDNQMAVDGFDLIRKDRPDKQNKAGGGIILYHLQAKM